MFPGYTQTLVVASQNPVKIEATRRGFARMFPRRTLYLHPRGGVVWCASAASL